MNPNRQRDIITFQKELSWDGTNPAHITVIRDFLLNFRGTIADDIWFDAETGKAKPFATDDGWTDTESERSQIRSAFELCEESRYWAKALSSSDASARHDPWCRYYSENFIAELDQITGARQGLASLPASRDKCHAFLEHSASALFELDGRSCSGNKMPVVCRTSSTLWLPVEALPAFQGIPPSQSGSWKHLLLSNLFETFSEATAEHLAILGFECDGIEPGFELAAAEQRNKTETISLPFFVADFDEYTHEPCRCSTADICHLSRLRAGTVCAAALNVFHRLAEIAFVEDQEHLRILTPVPPMVTMTFCAQHVRIWIAHRKKYGSPCKIDCIWKGDMTRLRDLVELKAIFGNISTWATSEFRNGISDYVSRWKDRFPLALSDEDEDEDEEIKFLITKVGNLKISRTNSLRFSNQPSVAETAAHEGHQPQTGDASNKTNDPDIMIIVESTEGPPEPDSLPTPASPSSTRKETTTFPPSRLDTPRPSRPRGNSTGTNISRDSNPSSSFQLSSEARGNTGMSTHGDTLQVRKLRSQRPRSFDASEFEGAKFAFDVSPTRSESHGRLGARRNHVRIFSGHDLDAEEFTFIARASDALVPEST